MCIAAGSKRSAQNTGDFRSFTTTVPRLFSVSFYPLRLAQSYFQLSVLCADPYPLDLLLISVLGVDNDIFRAIRDPSQIGGGKLPICSIEFVNFGIVSSPAVVPVGIVPVDVHFNDQRFAVDLHVGAYHSWLTAKAVSSTHGHVVVYSARLVTYSVLCLVHTILLPHRRLFRMDLQPIDIACPRSPTFMFFRIISETILLFVCIFF